MAQAVSRRPLTGEARVRAQVSPCGICGLLSDTRTGLSEFFGFSLSIPFHHGYPYSHVIWGMSTPVGGRSSETQSHPINMNKVTKLTKKPANSPPKHFRAHRSMEVSMKSARDCCPILTRAEIWPQILVPPPPIIKIHKISFQHFIELFHAYERKYGNKIETCSIGMQKRIKGFYFSEYKKKRHGIYIQLPVLTSSGLSYPVDT
jgi:hypothetical protein